MEWVSVDEELPEDGVDVLICGNPNEWGSWSGEPLVTEGRWSSAYNHFVFGEWDDFFDVTHWMPIPPPPPELTEDENKK